MDRINSTETSALVEGPYRIDGKMPEVRERFYCLAKDKVRLLSNGEMQEWQKKAMGKTFSASPASYILFMKIEGADDSDYFDKWVTNLEIAVNTDAFRINGKDYSDLIPIALEHEIYEAWLSAKKGAASSLSVEMKHLLARRQELRLAQKEGLIEKLVEWNRVRHPWAIREIEAAIGQI